MTNVQNSMLLLAAFVQGRRDLLAAALEDRMHQPYRARLCPLLPALQKLAADAPGILGAVLSGAGPSVLIFLDDKVGAERAKAQVRRQLQARGLEAELIATAITKQGAGQGKAWTAATLANCGGALPLPPAGCVAARRKKCCSKLR